MSRAVGTVFESHALAFLEQRGMTLVERNACSRRGEVDLVMRDAAGVLVFVEVRARAARRVDARFGAAAASIGARKRRRIVHAAQLYLARWRGAPPPCRFDVVAFDAGRIEWLRDAFDMLEAYDSTPWRRG